MWGIDASCHTLNQADSSIGSKRWMEICHQGRHFQLFRADYCETMFQGNVPEKKKKWLNQKQMLQRLLASVEKSVCLKFSKRDMNCVRPAIMMWPPLKKRAERKKKWCTNRYVLTDGWAEGWHSNHLLSRRRAACSDRCVLTVNVHTYDLSVSGSRSLWSGHHWVMRRLAL